MNKLTRYIGAVILLAGALGLGLSMAVRLHWVDWTHLSAKELPGSNAGTATADQTGDKPGISAGDKGDAIEEDYYEPCDPADTGVTHGVELHPETTIEATPQELAAGVESVTRVSLSDQAKNLAAPGHTPRPGDHLKIEIAPERIYELKVLDVIDMQNGTYLLATEVLNQPYAKARVLLCESGISVEIIDPQRKRIFRLSYNLLEQCYTVTEYDMNRLPKPCPY